MAINRQVRTMYSPVQALLERNYNIYTYVEWRSGLHGDEAYIFLHYNNNNIMCRYLQADVGQ